MEMKTVTQVTLSEDDLREAVVAWVADSYSGDGPLILPESIKFSVGGIVAIEDVTAHSSTG